MKYISNMQKRRMNENAMDYNKRDYVNNKDDSMNIKEEKAVFPPDTVIPEKVRDESVMYLPENNNYYVRDNQFPKSKSQHGYMDYDGMEFPFRNGMVLRRENTSSNLPSAENRMNKAAVCSNKNFMDFVCANMGMMAYAEFFCGADTYVQKTGILSDVGRNYIVLENPKTKEKTVCSMSNMKFLTFSNEEI